ncbi:MAG: glycine dehydrogenase [Bacteroidia bacterium]|nr:glycine dehydrogenase [Bacteroidia bacterium]
MTKKKSILISCEEANHTCDKSQYAEASFLEKIKLSLHLLFCRACRKYSANNAKLTELMQHDEIECMKKNEKSALKEAFKKEMIKGN